MRRFLHKILDIATKDTAVAKKVVIVNSRYWNRKELWGSSSTNSLFLLAGLS